MATQGGTAVAPAFPAGLIDHDLLNPGNVTVDEEGQMAAAEQVTDIVALGDVRDEQERDGGGELVDEAGS
jgi:hypothetical protein